MLFTWHPRLGRHILWQECKACVYLTTLLLVPFLFPFLVDFAMGSGVLPASFFLFHIMIVILLARHSWHVHKRDSLLLFRKCENHQKSDTHTIVEVLSRKASLRDVPRLLSLKENLVNFAVLSLLGRFEHYLLFDAPAGSFTRREIEVAFAHEIAHIKHRNHIWEPFICTGRDVFLCTLLFTSCVMVATIFTFNGPLPKVWLVLYLVALCGYFLWHYVLPQAYIRTTEYLADAGAITFTGWDYRFDLISILLKLEKSNTSNNIRKIFDDHPSNADRAKALGIELLLTKDGYEIVETCQ